MTLPTFNPAVAPSPGATTDYMPQLYEASFGDGYSQDTPKGINALKRKISLRWTGLTPAQSAAINTFFVGRAGFRSFYYQPFGFTAPVKWRCKSWSVSSGAPFSIQADLEESFTNET